MDRINDPRKPFYQVGEGRPSQTASDPKKLMCLVQLTLPRRCRAREMLSSDPVTKQTARLNWKDFRLRATLYVTIGKKGQSVTGRVDALGWWRYCDFCA